MKKFITMLAVVALMALGVQATTYTNYPASVGTGGGLPAQFSGGAYLLKAIWNTASVSQGGNGMLANGDIIWMIYIPAGTYVHGVGIYLGTPAHTASGASITVGDSSAVDNWLTTTYVTNGAAATVWSTPSTFIMAPVTGGTITAGPVNSLGKLYTSADYIKVVVSGAPTNLVLTVKAVAFPISQ